MNELDLRGLDDLTALSDFELSEADKAGVGELSVSVIRRNERQARRHFDEAKLQELAESIASQGVIQPIIVKPLEDGLYEIVAGERRWRAAQLAGLTMIPVVIKDGTTSYTTAIENIQREDLSPLEIADFIAGCLEAGDKKGQIAKQLGKKLSWVSEHAALIKAPAEIRELAGDKTVGIRTLYDLTKGFKRDAERLREWLAQAPEITRASVAAFLAGIDEPPAGAADAAPAGEDRREDGLNPRAPGDDSPAATADAAPTGDVQKEESSVASGGSVQHAAAATATAGPTGDSVETDAPGHEPPAAAAGSRRVVVEFAGRRAVVTGGTVTLSFVDTGDATEASLSELVFVELLSDE